MERRRFILGTLASIAGSDLIVKASESEVAAFGKPDVGTPVGVDTRPSFMPRIECGSWLYNDIGERIAVVRDVWDENRHQPMSSYMELPDGKQVFYTPQVRLRLIADVAGGFAYEGGLLRLRANGDPNWKRL